MLSRFVPGPLVRFFARPYVAGSSVDAALDCAAKHWSRSGLDSTLDLLGEDVQTQDQVDANVEVYARTIRFSAQDTRFDGRRRPTVSVKPSAFTTGEPEDCVAPIRQLVELAHAHDIAVTIDMEDRRWTDFTLAFATSLFAEGFDVGTVLQTRLLRTPKDVESIPAGMRVRLVIGIYPEPSEVALTHKPEMKARMLDCSEGLLARGARVEFATHDEPVLERFAKELAPSAPDRCEVQMLLGVPRAEIQEKLLLGTFGCPVPVRLYVPFAMGWEDATAYLRRRMDESPSMIFLVLRNLFRPRRALQLPASVEGGSGS
ncbi:MAG: proline dehydrogenase family protein [Myxococcota bacterium]